jgi:aspartyl-tRNA(Asn)/glutamyl-tRNA(Gln) amidotransferase subunit A
MQSGVSKASGLPLSVQFVGRAHDEVTLLRVAAAYERVTQWRHRRPSAMYRGGSQRERITVTA